MSKIKSLIGRAYYAFRRFCGRDSVYWFIGLIAVGLYPRDVTWLGVLLFLLICGAALTLDIILKVVYEEDMLKDVGFTMSRIDDGRYVVSAWPRGVEDPRNHVVVDSTFNYSRIDGIKRSLYLKLTEK